MCVSVCVWGGGAALATQQTAEGAGKEGERTEGLLLKHAAQVRVGSDWTLKSACAAPTLHNVTL